MRARLVSKVSISAGIDLRSLLVLALTEILHHPDQQKKIAKLAVSCQVNIWKDDWAWLFFIGDNKGSHVGLACSTGLSRNAS